LDIVLEHDVGVTNKNGVQETGQANTTKLTGQMVAVNLHTNAAGSQSVTQANSRMKSHM
jgi:predicted Zn-dependent protease